MSTDYVTSNNGLVVPNPWQEREGKLLIRWRFNGEEGEHITPEEWHYNKNTATGKIDCFWWEEGNGGCDCNRSINFGLAAKYPDKCHGDDGNGLPESFLCGNTIEIVSITEANTN